MDVNHAGFGPINQVNEIFIRSITVAVLYDGKTCGQQNRDSYGADKNSV